MNFFYLAILGFTFFCIVLCLKNIQISVFIYKNVDNIKLIQMVIQEILMRWEKIKDKEQLLRMGFVFVQYLLTVIEIAVQ